MPLSVRRVGPGDESVLELLAREDADYEAQGWSAAPRRPLDGASARTYLSDPGVLHWIAEDGGAVLGAISACLLRKRAGDPAEVLLYEIGVRAAHRRRGVGRALVETLYGWMRAHDVHEVWVLAGNESALEFYRACGFSGGSGPAVYLQRLV
ncbi:MAG: N-acetyltransferase family protein [Myxococcales bacterium]